jgi:hypothetical protein
LQVEAGVTTRTVLELGKSVPQLVSQNG